MQFTGYGGKNLEGIINEFFKKAQGHRGAGAHGRLR